MTVKRILVLGSGMVAPPCIEYLSRNPNNTITIGK
jgi:saccharopine dehydrogenase (NADP+, L-glutamate forming)